MSQLIVSAQEITNKKNTLATLKNTLETQVSQMETLNRSLDGMWEGPAKEKYAAALNIDIAKIKLFIKVIGEFISILYQIIVLYKTMEKKNIATATG